MQNMRVRDWAAVILGGVAGVFAIRFLVKWLGSND